MSDWIDGVNEGVDYDNVGNGLSVSWRLYSRFIYFLILMIMMSRMCNFVSFDFTPATAVDFFNIV